MLRKASTSKVVHCVVGIARLASALLASALLTSACSGIGGKSTPTPTPAAAEFNPVVSVTGAVVPARWATLSMPAAGIATEVLVREGDMVKAGQRMLRLSGSDRLQAVITAAELEVLAAQKDLSDLLENAASARGQAQLRLAEAQKAFDKAKKHRAGQEFRVGSQNQIDQARGDLLLAQDDVKRAEEAFNGVADRADEDLLRAEALSLLAAARQRRDKAQSNLNYLLSLPDNKEVAEADAQLEVARLELETARREYDRLKDGPDLKTLGLSEARLKNAQTQLTASRNSLSDLELKAPFDGTICQLYLKAQEWVNPGQPALLLADLSGMQVETTDLSEIDVARIETGDPADMTFDALPGVQVKGSVLRIAPKSGQTAGVNYTVVIELKEVPARLRWGMTAFVDIQTRQAAQENQ